MRIAFYISTVSGGGAARVITNLANKFAEGNNEVILITNIRSDSAYPISKKVKRVCIDHTKGYRNTFSKNLYRIIKLRQVLKRNKVDCCVSFMTENNIRCIIAGLFLNTKTITSLRTDPSVDCGNGLRATVIKAIYRLCDGIIFQTADQMHWFPKKTYNKGTIILNQIDEEYYTRECRTPDKKNIITVGRFTSAKDHIMLIKAYANIADYTDEKLILYGDGELRKNYEELIESLHLEEKVILAGTINDIIPCYDSAKIFVLSSIHEGMPNALMEAMVREVPVISTDCPCGGPRYLLNNGEYGILVDVGKEEQMSQAIKELLLNEESRKRYSEKLHIRKMDFRTDIVFNQWETYISEVVTK